MARRVATGGWEQADTATSAADALPAESDTGESERFDLLRVRFDLDAPETDLLRVALAAERSTAGHLVMGLLSGDRGPARPTVAVGLELSGVDPTGEQARRLLGETSRLRRCGLLELRGDDVLLSRRLVVPDRVAEHLAGVDTPSTWILQACVAPLPAVDLDTDEVCAALTSGQPLVWIHAPAGTAGAALATAACRRLGVLPWVFDLGRLPPGQPVEALLLECGLIGALPVLLQAERVSAEQLFVGGVPVLAVSTQPWDSQWADQLPVTIVAPRWTAADRRRAWHDAGMNDLVSNEIDAMPLSAEQIIRAARHAATMAAVNGESDVGADRIRASVRQLGRVRGVRAHPGARARLDDLVLPPHAMQEIRRLLDWAHYRDDIVGVRSQYTTNRGVCALFAGPPGTGKTLAARVVADSLAMDLFQVDLSSTVDKYIGETEKNLERVFAEAEELNAVLFFDEADALFGSRSEVRDARDRYANQEIAYLLQRMETFDGITVLASNLRGNIDPAFARRLHFIVSFPDPDEPTRARLWAQHLRPHPQDPNDPILVQRLAAVVDLAGGDIRNIVLSARYAAAADSTPLGMRHVEDAVRREYTKLGRRQPELPLRPN